ncbi:MAG: IS3 family transposase [Polyangiaceae bacterium]
MRRSKFSEAQIIGFLKQHEAGKSAKEISREAGVVEHTFYRWKAKYGGLEVSQAQEKRRLEDENRRLKQIVADQTLDIAALKSVVGKKVVTAAKRRGVVTDLRTTFGMSERRACRLVALNRSTQQYRARRRPDDKLRARLRELAALKPRWGYRMLHDRLRREGWSDNRKRVYRVYRLEGLAVRRRSRKRLRSQARVPPPMPSKINQRWSMDFMHDRLTTERTFRTLNIVDDFSRESLAIEVDFSLPGQRVVRVLDRLAETRGLPATITIDNGPEFTSRALDAWAHAHGVKLAFSRPGKPVDNAFVESFNGRFRDECLNTNWFHSLQEARAVIEAWRDEYNTMRPHSSLGGLSPEEFKQRWFEKIVFEKPNKIEEKSSLTESVA